MTEFRINNFKHILKRWVTVINQIMSIYFKNSKLPIKDDGIWDICNAKQINV